MTKICYITSKRTDDTRVFYKECISLKKYGYDVCILGQNTEHTFKSGIEIKGVESTGHGFFYRNFILPKVMFKEALKTNADIFHFHDPGLLRFNKRFKKEGKKIIFDSFEDHPTLLFEKKKIPLIVIKLLSKLYAIYEKKQCKNVDGIICCYHWTFDRLKTSCTNIQLVFNFPIIDNNNLSPHNFNNNSEISLCYTGLISPIWNIENIIKVLPKVNVKLYLAGNSSEKYIKQLQNQSGWSNVNYFGLLPKNKLKDKIFDNVDVGIAILGYIPLCKGTIGNLSNNKMFEYMMAGLPIICTDFVLWKEIVEKNRCGICVNPYNLDEIINAIEFFKKNKNIAIEMGKNGQKIIKEKYNWATQEQSLINVYNNL